MKTKILVAAVLFFSFTVAAFAATQFQVSSTPVTTVVASGRTEKTGDILFEAVGSSYTVTGTITITYPVAVTYIPAGTPPGSGAIRDVTSAAGTTAPTFTNPAYVPGSNQRSITFSITPSATTPALSYTFRLTGLRVDVADNPGARLLSATITTTGNTIIVGQTDPRILNERADGIASFTGTTPVRINAVTGVVSGSPAVVMTATEGFVNAFGVTVASDSTQLNTQRLEIRLNQAVPAGITVAFSTNDQSGHWQLLAGWTGPLTSASGTAPRVYYELIQDTDVTNVETFVVTATVTANAATTGAYPNVDLIAEISLAPVQAEAAPSAPAGGATAVPRYNYAPVGAVHLVNFFSPTTTLLVPFAYNNPPNEEFPDQPVYNTGFALSNTTTDPGATVLGFPGAVEQSGDFTMYLYNDDGTVTTVNSADLPQKSILTDGALATGTSYTVLLSEVLTAGEAEQLFSGYIFIVCNFTNAHGEFFVTDFSTFTHGALMLAVVSDRAIGPEVLGN